MVKITEIIILIFRFIFSVIGIGLNIKRVSSTKSNALDDVMFILSIILGVIFGLYWDKVISLFINNNNV